MCAPRTCLPPQKKSARAYALARCAPRICLPQKIGSRLRARYVRSAHMFARYVRSAPPPIIYLCPLLAPPLFKSWCRHCFNIKRGVRQGDQLLSPYLFLLAIETLTQAIRKDILINGVQFGEHEIRQILYADDITLFVKMDIHQ